MQDYKTKSICLFQGVLSAGSFKKVKLGLHDHAFVCEGRPSLEDDTGALCDMGALILAVLAKRHKIPLRLLPAEHRKRFLGDPKSILSFEGQLIAPKGTHGYVPLVEWVSAKYLRKSTRS